MTAIGFTKRNEKSFNMKNMAQKFTSVLKEIFSLIFKGKDDF